MEKENNSTNKRERMQYADLFFSFYNSFVMSFMVLIIVLNLTLVIITHVFIIILLIGVVITFIKNNPFFNYFVNGTLICGAFYALPGIIAIPSTNFSYGIFDYIIFAGAILEILYLIFKTKDSQLLETWGKMALIRERAQYDASLYYALNDPEGARIQEEKALEMELKENLKKREYYKQYKRSWILTISSISVLGYYVAYFSSFTL